MLARAFDLYLAALVGAAIWLTVEGAQSGSATGSRAWYPACMVAAFAAVGWLAAVGGGNRFARGLMRLLAGLAATAIVAALALSRTAAG